MAVSCPVTVSALPPYRAYSPGPLMNCAIPYAPLVGLVSVVVPLDSAWMTRAHACTSLEFQPCCAAIELSSPQVTSPTTVPRPAVGRIWLTACPTPATPPARVRPVCDTEPARPEITSARELPVTAETSSRPPAPRRANTSGWFISQTCREVLAVGAGGSARREADLEPAWQTGGVADVWAAAVLRLRDRLRLGARLAGGQEAAGVADVDVLAGPRAGGEVDDGVAVPEPGGVVAVADEHPVAGGEHGGVRGRLQVASLVVAARGDSRAGGEQAVQHGADAGGDARADAGDAAGEGAAGVRYRAGAAGDHVGEGAAGDGGDEQQAAGAEESEYERLVHLTDLPGGSGRRGRGLRPARGRSRASLAARRRCRRMGRGRSAFARSAAPG